MSPPNGMNGTSAGLHERSTFANVDFQFVTTLNEWNEGTGYGANDKWQFQYLDVLHALAPRTS